MGCGSASTPHGRPPLPEWLPDLRLEGIHVGKATVDLEAHRRLDGSTSFHSRGEGLTASRAAATSAGVVRKPRRACCSRAPLPDRLSFPCLRLAPCLSCAPAARPGGHDPVAVRSATSDLLWQSCPVRRDRACDHPPAHEIGDPAPAMAKLCQDRHRVLSKTRRGAFAARGRRRQPNRIPELAYRAKCGVWCVPEELTCQQVGIVEYLAVVMNWSTRNAGLFEASDPQLGALSSRLSLDLRDQRVSVVESAVRVLISLIPFEVLQLEGTAKSRPT